MDLSNDEIKDRIDNRESFENYEGKGILKIYSQVARSATKGARLT